MKKIIITITALLALWVAWYLISPLFITIEVDEALPENIITSDVVTNTDSNAEFIAEDVIDEPGKTVNEDMPVGAIVMEDDESLGLESSKEPVNPPAGGEESLQPARNPVMGTPGHRAEGTVQLLQTTDGQIIRYEDFETVNGPSLHVYLANDLDAKDYVDLGPIKGTKGNINYEIPEGINAQDYKYVMYWCVPFNVLFNYAEIN